jgi:hypothetical protein
MVIAHFRLASKGYWDSTHLQKGGGSLNAHHHDANQEKTVADLRLGF